MTVRLFLAAVSAAFLCGCGNPSGDDFSITVTAPPAGGAVADHSYIVSWDVEIYDEWSDDALVSIYADTDTDPSSGLVLLADSLDVGTTGWLWDCSAFPAADYFVRAELVHGTDETADYSDGMITITHEGLGDVQGVEVVADSCSGDSVYIRWDALAGATGYRVYFDADGTSAWAQVGETASTWFLHEAPGAGIYGVKGMREGEISPGFPDSASTMPILIDSVYTIWDDQAPAGAMSAAQLTPCGADLWEYDASVYNIYCYQAGQPSPPCLFSGSAPPVGNGLPTQLVDAGGAFSAAPGTGWSDSLFVHEGDVIFGWMSAQGFFVKLLVDSVPEYPGVPGSRGIAFHYEFQSIQGLRLFTGASR